MPNQDLNPQNGKGGTSPMYGMGLTANTRTAVSQKVRVLTPHYGNSAATAQTGVVSSFGVTQSKTVEEVRGVGFGDKLAELVPSITGVATGNFERTLMYLCNLWQATGYAAGVSGPVRSLAHHTWPFDVETQLVFSKIADADLGVANRGLQGTAGTFQGGVKPIEFPQTTYAGSQGASSFDPTARGHSALITMHEACWFTSHGVTYSKDSGIIMETGDSSITDIHDYASVYGEFMPTGNDPTIGQIGSIRFADMGGRYAQAGASLSGGGTISEISSSTL